ncbi:unnamed protein product [Blepharisma stoltei]|uniref:PiggyBac transposable element-derived protein domain-containing protein n=1 Tax=Blepharisma stoltei TaxID=1481888 RepID=A0AAU9JI52_9CILI|nr:unnamed protein product [Blepharisma stoltei]
MQSAFNIEEDIFENEFEDSSSYSSGASFSSEDEATACTDEFSTEEWTELTKLKRQDTIPLMDPQPGQPQPDQITPLSLFRIFFDEEVLEEITNNSNDYAKSIFEANPIPSRRMGDMTPLTPRELENWLGIAIMMGLIKAPKQTDYWSTIPLYHNKLISGIMPSRRFQAISRMMHLSPLQYYGSNKLSKIEPILSMIRERCKANYCLGKYISIDESMIQFKGRHQAIQYMPAKPIKWGFKVFALCDSVSGYMWNFYIFSGKSQDDVHSTMRVVLRLIESLQGSFHKHYLFFDRWYSSIELFNSLSNLGLAATGTVNPNRKGLPKASISKKTRNQFFLRGDLLFCAWYDHRPIYLLSNIEGIQFNSVKRTAKEGTEKNVEKPVIVSKYTFGMGGVDYYDQLIQAYSTHRKSVKWWKSCFHYLIEIAVTNSFIIYKHYSTKGIVEAMSHEKFTRLLAEQLTKDVSQEENEQLAEKMNKVSRCRYCVEHQTLQSKKCSKTRHCCHECKKPIHLKCMKLHECK